MVAVINAVVNEEINKTREVNKWMLVVVNEEINKTWEVII